MESRPIHFSMRVRVSGAEVIVELQVALIQVTWGQGRIFAVEAALDGISDDEGNATGAVVGARAVVVDPSTELGKQEQDHIVGGVVLL